MCIRFGFWRLGGGGLDERGVDADESTEGIGVGNSMESSGCRDSDGIADGGSVMPGSWLVSPDKGSEEAGGGILGVDTLSAPESSSLDLFDGVDPSLGEENCG